MRKLIVLFVILIAAVNESDAQLTRYIVRFKNKGGTPFTLANPSAYLSQRAIERRTKHSIAIDSTDLPVSPSYINQLRNVPNVTVLNISKWLNSVSIQTTDPNAITTINNFSFVQNTTAVAGREITNGKLSNFKFQAEEITAPYYPSGRNEQVEADYFNYGTGSLNEIHLHNGEFLHNIGLRGQGMQIAMLDDGYNNYTTARAFDSARANNQILDTWDFVNREQNVINDGAHGMSCMSTIAANIPGQFIGKAPKANFWLYRTEDNASEYPIEEHNWACGAERADSSGTDLISSSLGYGYDFDGGIPNYVYSTLNGNTTMSALAADLAAKKGILVFVSAGNAGSAAWHFITTPSDGDSVVCVGAVNSNGAVGSFSSYGPSGDGQIKPDMASVGVAALIQSGNTAVVGSNGTSFACPNMAGLASCLWQGFPEYNNMKIVQALKEAGSRFTNPDDRVGYGIPNVKLAFANLLKEYSTAAAVVNNCSATISWNSKDVQGMKYEIERRLTTDTGYIKIAEQPAQNGLTLANQSYQFVASLNGLQQGPASYRIKQVIDTAAASYYTVYTDTVQISIPAGCITDRVAVIIRSNPVTASPATLEVTTPGTINNMSIHIFDVKGSLVMQMRESKTSGTKLVSLPTGHLSAGLYYVKVMDGTTTIGTAELLR
jgi:serine protease AprX